MAQGTQIRVEELAAQYEAVNDAIVDTVSGCTAEGWQRVTASEGWPVAVVAHHVTQVQGFFVTVLAGLSSAESSIMAVTMQDINENNARHARDFAGVGKSETLDALRENGAALKRLILDLDDEKLALGAFVIDGQELNGEQVIEFGLIGHFHEHLGSIRATIGG
jgi:uncharacterized damage-inducible protein DinB